MTKEEIQRILEIFQSDIERNDWNFLSDKDAWIDIVKEFAYSWDTDRAADVYMKSFCGFLIENGINIFQQREIPNGFLKNNNYVFEADVPAGCVTIGDKAFAYALNLKELKIANSVRHIGLGMCMGCVQLHKVTLPKYCDDFNTNYAFFKCLSLQNITLPDNLKVIGRYCFAGSGLINITIPASVEVVRAQAFEDCKDLTTITIQGDKIPDGWDKNWLGNCQAKVVFVK